MNKEVLTSPVLEALLQAPSLAVTAVDKQGCVILWSPSASRMFGWTESEALGHFLPIMPQDQRQEFLDRMENGIKGGTLIAMESRRLRKDGTLIDVNLWTAPLKDGKGDIIGILGVHADVTSQKQMYQALGQTQAELQRVLASVSDYLWSGEFDPDGKFSYHYYSPAVERITGRPPEFYLASPERWLSTIHPEDRPRLAAALGRLQMGHSTREEEEYRFMLLDGTIRWVRDSVTVSQSANGRRHLNGVVSDITARRQTEEALHESQRELRRVLGAASDYFWSGDLDPEGRFRYLYYSPAVERITGRPAEFYMAGSERWMNTVHPQDRARLAEISEQLLSGRTASNENEHRIVLPDGTIRWVRARVTVSQSADGHRRLDGAVSDITARKQSEEALRESEANLARAQSLAHLGNWSWDIQKDQLSWSDEMYRIYGVNRETFGHNLSAFVPLIHPQDMPRQMEAIKAAEAGRAFEPFEVRVVHPDGSLRVVQLLGTEVERDASGRPKRIFGASLDITERKRAEMALRESEERYRLMAEAIPQPAWRTNAQGETTECNGRWCEYTGQTPEEARGNGWMKALHPDDVGCVMQKVKSDVASGDIYQAEYRLRRALDGSYRWHLARALPIKDKDGRIVCWFGSAADIDDQKRAQERLEERVRERTAELVTSNTALRESEIKFRTLVEELPAITYIAALDEANTKMYVSPQIQAVLGFTPAEYCANPSIWRRHVHPNDLERVMAEVRRTHLKGESFDCEYRMLHRTGEIVWIRDKATVVRNESGQPLFLQGVKLDVTERRQAEETMRLQSAALEAAANGIVITDCEGHILWANPAFAKLTGYELSEVIGKNSRVLKSGQHDKAFYRNLWQTVLSGQVWHGEMVNKRKDGSLYTEEMTITPVRNAAGEITHFIAIKRDITEWKLAEESRRHLAAIVESSNDAIVSADLDGIITSWNAAAQRLYNYAPEEIVGRSFFVLTPPNRMGELREMHKKVQGGENAHFETVRLRKGGFPVNVSITVSPTKNGAGEVIGTSAITRDITERKELEQAIVEASSREQRRIGHDLHDGLCQQLTGIGFLVEGDCAVKGLASPARGH